MPNFTPNFMLPYPAGTDRPCDAPDTWCAFATGTEAVLDSLDEVIARTDTNIPMAKLTLSTPYAIALTSGSAADFLIRYDTVQVDTDNMTNLSVDPNTIVVARPGLYSVRWYFELGTSGNTGNTWITQLQGVGPATAPTSINPLSGGGAQMEFADPNLANSMSWTLRAFWRVIAPGARFTTRILRGSIATNVAPLINRSEFDVAWMGD